MGTSPCSKFKADAGRVRRFRSASGFVCRADSPQSYSRCLVKAKGFLSFAKGAGLEKERCRRKGPGRTRAKLSRKTGGQEKPAGKKPAGKKPAGGRGGQQGTWAAPPTPSVIGRARSAPAQIVFQASLPQLLLFPLGFRYIKRARADSPGLPEIGFCRVRFDGSVLLGN